VAPRGEEIGALWEAALGAGWEGPDSRGEWTRVERRFSDGHIEEWWALEVEAGPYGPQRAQRAVVATTDPEKLPERKTWYLVTNLPHPSCSERSGEGDPAAAELAEVVRLYGLRMWVEQSYKQVKHTLGWSDYQVRSDLAMRRHWQLVCCAFSLCWWAYGRLPAPLAKLAETELCGIDLLTAGALAGILGLLPPVGPPMTRYSPRAQASLPSRPPQPGSSSIGSTAMASGNSTRSCTGPPSHKASEGTTAPEALCIFKRHSVRAIWRLRGCRADEAVRQMVKWPVSLHRGVRKCTA
jgi:hypothetical protein